MLKQSGLIVSVLLSLTLLLMFPISGSTPAGSAILVPNCGTGPTSLVPNVSQVATGSTGTIIFSCGAAGSAITVTSAGRVIPQFSLPPSYSSLAISASSTCASAATLTSGSPIVFGTGSGMLPITSYNYCAGFSNVPSTGLASFSITWSTVQEMPTITTTLSASTINVGGSVTDSATVTSSASPTGTVTFMFFAGSACSGTGTVVGSPVDLVSGSATSAPQTFGSAGTFSWNAVYSGDANNNGGTSSCETLSVVEPAGFTISANPTSLTVAPEDSSSCEGQGSAQRCDDEASSTITVTGLNGFSGTVTLTVSTSPNLSVSLSTLRITGSGTSTLTVSDGSPGNYAVTVTGTSGSVVHSVVVNVMVRPPVPLKCGGDRDCSIESDAPLSDVRFGDKKIHFTVDGTAGARGSVNVTIPRSAVSDIDRIEVSVDGTKLPRSALMIASDDASYHLYFSFTFHSPVVIDIDLAPAVTILGLAPLTLYGIVGAGIVVVVIGGILAVLRRRTAVQP